MKGGAGERKLFAASGARRLAPLEVLLFLVLWLAYGVLINSGNLAEFNLQQIGVEALAERGRFYLEGSRVPELQTRDDVFVYGGHEYAAKQPGQFMAGALAYTLVRPFGISYAENYLLASALVTFLTTSLLTALAGVALYRVAREMVGEGAGLKWPLTCALVYGFATLAFTYAGIAHHDAIASAYLLLAFYFAFRVARAGITVRGERVTATCAGLLLGLTITTSMLPFFMALVIGIYFASLGRWRLVPYLLAGGAAGLLPLFVYDAVSFGNPLLLPNVAGNYADTYFRIDPANFAGKLAFYARMAALYVPVFALGVVGLLLYPREFRREQTAMLALVFVLAAYLLNIDADGGCQYGPRYLLPAMPYACLGLLGFARLGSSPRRRAAGWMVAAAGLFSFAVNLAGAAHGSMYCDTSKYAFGPYVSAIARGETRTFPLAAWLVAPLLLSLVLFVYRTLASRRGEVGRG